MRDLVATLEGLNSGFQGPISAEELGFQSSSGYYGGSMPFGRWRKGRYVPGLGFTYSGYYGSTPWGKWQAGRYRRKGLDGLNACACPGLGTTESYAKLRPYLPSGSADRKKKLLLYGGAAAIAAFILLKK